MNLEEIVKRPHKEMVNQREMGFVIEQYILERKGKTVKVNIEKNNTILPRVFHLNDQVPKLIDAFIVASSWLKVNKYK